MAVHPQPHQEDWKVVTSSGVTLGVMTPQRALKEAQKINRHPRGQLYVGAVRA